MKKIQKKLCSSALLCCLVLGLLTGCGKADKAYKKGIELMEDSDYEAAALSLQSAIDINPEKAEYYITYGMILNHLEKYDEALEILDFIDNLNCDIAEVFTIRADIYKAKGNDSLAKEELEKACSIKPELKQLYIKDGE